MQERRKLKKGDGSTINVDVNSLELDFLAFSLDFESMEVGHRFSFSTLKGGIDQFLVYGSVSAKYYGDNNIRLYNDKYDFDQHASSKEYVRNIETWIGDKVHGKGTPFEIKFNGTYHITPRAVQLQLRRVYNSFLAL